MTTIQVTDQVPTEFTREGYEALDWHDPNAKLIDPPRPTGKARTVLSSKTCKGELKANRTDVARLSFTVKTSGLRKALRALNKLSRILKKPRRRVPKTNRAPRGNRDYL